jgi:hypothetical protein
MKDIRRQVERQQRERAEPVPAVAEEAPAGV